MNPDPRKCSWSLLSEATEIAPTILFTPVALKWIRAMVQEHSGEVGFYGIVEELDGTYVITEVFYPKHCLVSQATCEISPDGEVEIAQRLINENRPEDISKVRFWGHSHHTMGTTPSGQDNAQAVEKMNSNGAYYIRAIANKDGEMSVSFFDYNRQIKFENIKWDILQNYDSMVNRVISVMSTESNSEEKVLAIRNAININVNFQNKEYQEIAKRVRELKKIQLPETKSTKPYGHQRSIFDDDWEKTLNKRKKMLLTDKEIDSVINSAWTGDTPF